MNWEAAGAIGEILGAAVVVATLFYLAGQLRQNSISMKRNNEFALNDSIYNSQNLAHQVFSLLSTDGELADIYTRCMAGEELTPVEQTRYQWFVNSVLLYIEQLWNQQMLDLGWDEHDSDVLFQVMGPHITQLLSQEFAMAWWVRTAANLYLPEFRAKIDAVLAQNQNRELVEP